MIYKDINRARERGIVSLFVVIFAALLISTVTISFTRMMITAQQQATANDLSNSALDSAYAGIEDAKRLIQEFYDSGCVAIDANNFVSGSDTCDKIKEYIYQPAGSFNFESCKTIQNNGISGEPDSAEVNLESQLTDGQSMDQAYTCVKINLFPDEYIGTLDRNTPQIIPLSVEDNKKINKITLEWFLEKDRENASSTRIVLPSDTNNPKEQDWDPSSPPIMRAQLIQHKKNSIDLPSLGKGSSGGTNSRTLFLYPGSGDSGANFKLDGRDAGSVLKYTAKCKDNFSNTIWACKATIEVPNPDGLVDDDPRVAYLLLNQGYTKKSSFRITLDDKTRNFFNVQAKVDSTGRANDLFRRVVTRLNVQSSFNSMPIPEATVDSMSNLCKPNPSGTVGPGC